MGGAGARGPGGFHFPYLLSFPPSFFAPNVPKLYGATVRWEEAIKEENRLLVWEVSEDGEKTGVSAQQRKVTFGPLLTQVPLVRKPSADVMKQLTVSV